MRTTLRALGILVAVLALSACGGGGGSGGGGGGGAFEPEEGLQVTVTPAENRMPSNKGNVPPRRSSRFTTQVTVSVTRADGSAVPDGTSVNLSVRPVSVGGLSTLDDPATEANEVTTLFGQISAETSGGEATFFFTSGPDTGNATLRASADDPGTSRTSTGTASIEVFNGPPASERIQFQANRTRVPANIAGVAPFVGSPYIAEIQVSVNNADGTPVSNGTVVNYNVFPVERGAISTLDDPGTPDNEFLLLFGSGFDETNSGQVKLFFHSFDRPGTVELSVSYDDPETGETVFNTLELTVVEAGSTLLPESVTFNRQDQPVYIQGSGGRTAIQFEAIVEDGGAEPVPDPQGRNNLEIELINQGPSLGAELAGSNFAGDPVSGNRIRLATTAGRVSVTLRSGDTTGTQTIRATADREDNNVNNGIQDPVSNDFSIAISDGRLFSVTITSPNTNSILVNRVDPDAEAPAGPVPPDPDGSYSQVISAFANDRGGNPVVPGTQIQFGLIDAPLTGFPESGPGVFAISGNDGDPEEGRVAFFAPTGSFRTAGAGVGPGDTLVLFGDAVQGNEDLEGSRVVDGVTSPTNLRVATQFNLNDTTGSSVDNGPVIPYAIGRAEHGSIQQSAVTDDNGVATVLMHFPVSRVGQSAIIWAQGSGQPSDEGEAQTVGDVEQVVFPGVAPAQFTASPTQLPPNTTIDVLLCVADAVGTPLRGAFIDFNVTNDQGATVTVDGVQDSGTVQPATGNDGCTIATVVSTGVSPTAENIPILFTLGGLSATVEIVNPEAAALFAIPNAFSGNGFKDILLRLVDAGGAPISGVQIGVECSGESGSATVIEPPGVTDSNGETDSTVQANVDSIDGGGTAQCTFFTVPRADGGPEAVVTFRGADLCNFSPLPAGCEE